MSNQPGYVQAARESRLLPSRCSPGYATLRLLASRIRRVLADGELGELGCVVDLGCAGREYESLFAGRCERYLGCDLEGNPVAEHIIDASGRVNLPDGSAGTVLSLQVLEHVDDPHGYLLEAHRLLRSGGSLLLSTHGIWRYHPDPRDLWRWTGAGLREQLARAGFEVVSLSGLVGPAGCAVQLWQNATARFAPGPLRQLYFFLAQSLVLLLESQAQPREEDCAVMVVIARRAGAGR